MTYIGGQASRVNKADFVIDYLVGIVQKGSGIELGSDLQLMERMSF